jgi:hypothetical protein
MRKVFWCCLTAGAAVCCSFWAVAYISQNPDSPLGRYALAAVHGGQTGPAARSGQAGSGDSDDLIPPDPVPVEDPTPAPPEPGTALPPEVAALIPPIVIHEDDDLNAKPQAGAAEGVCAHPPYDVENIASRLDDAPNLEHAAPPMMPYCADDVSPVPFMPYCTEDEEPPTMPSADPDGQSNRGAVHPSDAFALWLGFFSGPTHLGADPSVGRCEEDTHYGQQYPGLPYTVRPRLPDQPARADLSPPHFPGADDAGQPPAPKGVRHVDPRDLFGRQRRLPLPHPVEPKSDTMEMRPTDWKPYSLDPGPF